MKPLGKNQGGTLDALRRHGRWSPGCGWKWSNHSETIRILDSLVRRSLVQVSKNAKGRPVYTPVDQP